MPTLIPKKITIEFEGVADPLVIEKPSGGSGGPNLLQQMHGIFLDGRAATFYKDCVGGSPGSTPPTTPASELRNKLDGYRQGHDPSVTTNPTTTSVDPFCIKLSDCSWWCPDQD